MADKPAQNSVFVAGIAEARDNAGNVIAVPVSLDTTFSPARLIIELPDRALRDMGVITLDQGVSVETGSIYNGSTALTPKFAFANVSASQTDSSLVTAVTSKHIRVHQVMFVAGATGTTLVFNSKPGGGGSAISPLFANAANSGASLPFSPMGWFQTAAGEGLTVTTGTGSATGILVGYTEV